MRNTLRAAATPTISEEMIGTQKTDRYLTSPNHSHSVYQRAMRGNAHRRKTKRVKSHPRIFTSRPPSVL
jgi:hypothetical protein